MLILVVLLTMVLSAYGCYRSLSNIIGIIKARKTANGKPIPDLKKLGLSQWGLRTWL